MHRYRLTAITLFAASIVVGFSGNAAADSVSAVDVTTGSRLIDFGPICEGHSASRPVTVQVTRSGQVSSGTVFEGGQVLAVATSATSGLAAATNGQLSLAQDWDTSIGAATSLDATVTLTAPANPGSFSGAVSFRVGGLKEGGGSLTLNRAVYVRAVVEDCGGVPTGDTTPPVLNMPADITVAAASSAGSTVDFVAAATDDVDGSVPVECSPVSGSMFAIGATTVTCTASDAVGNTATGDFTVAVALDVDGFFAPVSNDRANSVRHGSTVPLKFSVRTGDGSAITDPSVVQDVTIKSIDLLGTAPYEQTNSAPKINVGADQFVMPVTVPDQPGVYRISVTLVDGTTIDAWFDAR